jgi:TRAP-type transport system periplasmic protein
MNLRRRLIASTILAGLVALPVAATAADTKELRMGSPWPTSSPMHAALVRFAKEVDEKSSGAVKVRVYPDSQLGDIQALITGVQQGTVDMVFLSMGNAGVLKGGAALNVAYVPYLFDSKKEAERLANGELFTPIFDELATQSGVRIFGVYGSRSPRAVHNSKKAVSTPADLKGMKIRIPPIDGIRLAFDSMGAKPVVMGLGDTYNAISRNQVDGHENGIDAAIGYKWYEVAKHWSVTDHIFETGAWYVNEKVWQGFTADQRAMFQAAARTGGADMTAAGEKLDAEGVATMQAAGVTVTQVDKAAFREALKDVHLKLEGRVWPEGLVAKIRAAQSGAK